MVPHRNSESDIRGHSHRFVIKFQVTGGDRQRKEPIAIRTLHHHYDPWAESPYRTSNANVLSCFDNFRYRAVCADIVKLYRSFCTIPCCHLSISYQVFYRLRLLFPFMIPNITLQIFLLFSILQICPNRPSLLFFTVCIRSV